MRIETLCTGDELLTGVTVDTNSAYFAERVFAAGAMLDRNEVIGDRMDEIVEALRSLYSRADFAVVSGGLGPTSDDLTAEAAARAADVPLELHEPTLNRIRERFRSRNIEFTPNNERQARIPRGAEVVDNPWGTAPMFVVTSGRARVCFLPGVPREFHKLCDSEVMPRLRAALEKGGTPPRAVRTLKCFGIAESHIDHQVRDIPQRFPGVRVAFRTTLPENHLKLWAEAGTREAAEALLAQAETAARGLLGSRVFGADEDTFSAVVGGLLRKQGATVALAESCTGGLAAAILSETPGASDYLVGSLVTYTPAAKTKLAGIAPDLLGREGPVSETVTIELARAARGMGATLGLAVTGYAGPEAGTLPVGTVFVALDAADRGMNRRLQLPGDREQVRRLAAYAVLDQTRTYYRGAA
jgi:nicotinamide-nucleotide amidase